MKKLLGIVVLGLLLSENAHAFFGKNKFKFQRCYTESFSNHDEWINNSMFLRWEWEIDLKKKIATRYAQMIVDDQKLDVKQFRIGLVTDELIMTKTLGEQMYTFFRKTGVIEIKTSLGSSKMFCEKFK